MASQSAFTAPHGGSRLPVASGAHRSATPPATARAVVPLPRVVPLGQVRDFRDLGGYPTADGGVTRHGVLYRSAALTDVDQADRGVLAGLRLAAVVDLRSTFEAAALPAASLPAPRDQTAPVRFHIPVVDAEDAAAHAQAVAARTGGSADLAACYRDLLDRGAAGFARAARVVATHAPAVVFCSTGKDRTGLLCALLLTLAGVPARHVIADWACSAPLVRPVTLDRGGDTGPIEAALAHLDRHAGGVRGYLMSGGLASHELGRLARVLVTRSRTA
jgi:protein-tyrosine phosphatase